MAIDLNKAKEVVSNSDGVFDINTAEKHTNELTNRVAGMAGISKAIKAALKSGIDADYAIIPGCNKPSLLQPGARKIALLFGLIPEYKIEFKEVNYNAKWTQTLPKKDGGFWEKTIEGHFEYEVSATLRTQDGKVIASGIGSACNREKGKADMPANSILKMSKKRAFVDAVLSIADMAATFTQDVEDFKTTTTTTTATTATPQGGYTSKWIKR